MQTISTYLPIDWVLAHPFWLLVMIGCTAFIESLAVIGIIVPGIMLLFALGFATGQTETPLSYVLLAGSLGAISGDSTSFLIGRHFHKNIRNLWPFSHHQARLEKCERYFDNHGIISIILGRFIGPLRPLLPVVAGMLRMRPSIFFPVNILSSLAWAPVYLLPGYTVGNASAQHLMFTASHWRLAAIMAATLWLLNYLTQKALLPKSLRLWQPGSLYPQLVFSGCAILFVTLGVIVDNAQILNQLNAFIHQSIMDAQHPWITKLFIAITSAFNRGPVILSGTLMIGLLMVKRWYREAFASLLAAVLLIAPSALFKDLFAIPRPPTATPFLQSLSYPSAHTTSVIIFAGVVTRICFRRLSYRWQRHLLTMATISMGLVALSRLYLGLHWVTDIIGAALYGISALALFHLVYDRTGFTPGSPRFLIVGAAIIVVLSTLTLEYETLVALL